MKTFKITELNDVLKETLEYQHYSSKTTCSYLAAFNSFVNYCNNNGVDTYTQSIKRKYLYWIYEKGGNESVIKVVFNKLDKIIGKIDGNDSTIFDDILDKFEYYLKSSQVSIENVKQHISVVKKFLMTIDDYGINNLNEIDYSIIHSLFNQEEGKFWFTVGLRRFFKFCYTHKYIDEDKSFLLPKYKKHKPIPNVYSSEEMDKIIKYVDSDSVFIRDKVIFYLAYETALRTCDIENLKLSDIDLDRKEITLIQAKTKEKLKTGLSDKLTTLLKKYIKDIRQSPDEINDLIVWRQINGNYKELSRTMAYKIVSDIIKNSGIDTTNRRNGPHSLRATRATELLNNDVPLPVISTYLGHTSTESTKNYLKVDLKHLRMCNIDPPIIKSKALSSLLGVSYED